MRNDVILKVDHVYKTFGPTKALVNVSLQVKYGEIHGLIGENGSGKSTLSSIIAGAQKADSGTMVLDGVEYKPSNPLEAKENRISMIVQEQGTVGSVTVAANVFIGMEHLFTRFGVLNVKMLYTETKRILDYIGASHIKPDMLIDTLSFEDRKLVEIARAMYSKPKLLIIDETTTALAKRGRDILYSMMNKLRSDGMSVLFISHDIDELIALCDSVTVLRDGNITGVLDKSEMEPGRMKQLMVGREIGENFYRPDYECSYSDEVVLQSSEVSYGVIKDISVKLHKGEILGIGGLTDCGMHQFGKLLFGLMKPEKGCISTGDGKIVNNPKKAINYKIGYISKNRDKEALMTAGSIKDNICLPSLDKIKKLGIITRKAEKDFTSQWVKKLSVKMSSIDQYCMYLSGGNKQKVSIAKWLANDSEILILDCPTRGIDVGVKASIYSLMSELKSQGKAIIIISEELPELIGMSDRILILKSGRISAEFKRSKDLSEAEIIQYMI